MHTPQDLDVEPTIRNAVDAVQIAHCLRQVGDAFLQLRNLGTGRTLRAATTALLVGKPTQVGSLGLFGKEKIKQAHGMLDAPMTEKIAKSPIAQRFATGTRDRK